MVRGDPLELSPDLCVPSGQGGVGVDLEALQRAGQPDRERGSAGQNEQQDSDCEHGRRTLERASDDMKRAAGAALWN
jgi:hypothetical protein